MLFEDNWESSSSDEELLVDYFRQSKQKNENYLEEIVPNYTNTEFMEHFRLSRQVVQNLSEQFAQTQYFHHQSGEFGKLNADDFVIIFLWYAGHEAASYRDVADRFCISLSTLRKVIERMTYFLSNLSPQIITWPNYLEQQHIKQQFSTNGFENVIGAIDGSHVRIDKPSEDPDSYLNRKGFYSIQVSSYLLLFLSKFYHFWSLHI